MENLKPKNHEQQRNKRSWNDGNDYLKQYKKFTFQIIHGMEGTKTIRNMK